MTLTSFHLYIYTTPKVAILTCTYIYMYIHNIYIHTYIHLTTLNLAMYLYSYSLSSSSTITVACLGSPMLMLLDIEDALMVRIKLSFCSMMLSFSMKMLKEDCITPAVNVTEYGPAS